MEKITPAVENKLSTSSRSATSLINPSDCLVKSITGGGVGFRDGPSAVAAFQRPNGITVDAQDNLYVADFGNHKIRRISAEGIVTTLAGSMAGYRDEPETLALFNGPRGIVYVNGYLYVTDLNNAVIRRISMDGLVKTVAGNGIIGIKDGIAHQAQFEAPRAITTDGAGSIFVADGARVRRITGNGKVQTIAGSTPGFQDGLGQSALFGILGDITLDKAGNIYVADVGNKLIRKIDRSGIVTTLSTNSSNSKTNSIIEPVAVSAAEDGTLYVIDAEDFSIKCLLPTQEIICIAGNGRQGHRDGQGGREEGCAEFWTPTGLALSKNKLYVTDREVNLIRVIQLPENLYMSTSHNPIENNISHPLDYNSDSIELLVPTSCNPIEYNVATLAGSTAGFQDATRVQAKLNGPMGLCVDHAGTVYVTDHFNNCIRRITTDGIVLTLAGNIEGGYEDSIGTNAKFNGPIGIAVDLNNKLYIADHLNGCIRSLSLDGEVETLAGTGILGFRDGSNSQALFEGPKGIAVSSTGRLFVADGTNIRCVEPDGTVITLAGSTRGYKNGRGSDAEFGWPYALAVDLQENCYVTDAANHAIRKVSPDGNVTTIFDNNSDSEYRLNFPSGIAVDVDGIIYVADTNNHRILRLTCNTEGKTIASLICGSQQGSKNGRGDEAALNCPRGIGIGPNGEIYIADSGSHRIVKITTNETKKVKINSGSFISKTTNPEKPLELISIEKPKEVITLSEIDSLAQEKSSPAIISLSKRRQRLATQIFDWGIELTGNNIIRTESDGSLYLNTNQDLTNSAFFFKPWEAHSENEVVIEVCMQLLSYTGDEAHTGSAIWFENDKHADTLIIQPNGIRLLRTPALSYSFDTTTEKNLYSIIMNGANITVLVNGEKCLEGQNQFWLRSSAKQGDSSVRRWLAFGDGSSNAGSESLWEFIKYTIK